MFFYQVATVLGDGHYPGVQSISIEEYVCV